MAYPSSCSPSQLWPPWEQYLLFAETSPRLHPGPGALLSPTKRLWNEGCLGLSGGGWWIPTQLGCRVENPSIFMTQPSPLTVIARSLQVNSLILGHSLSPPRGGILTNCGIWGVILQDLYMSHPEVCDLTMGRASGLESTLSAAVAVL